LKRLKEELKEKKNKKKKQNKQMKFQIKNKFNRHQNFIVITTRF
jgi:hypothetical protein